jgi:hypothetical protein
MEDRKMEMFLAVVLSVVASDRPVASSPNDVSQASVHRVPIAIVDVAKIFKEARDFNQKMQSIKLQFADFDRAIKTRSAENPPQSTSVDAEVKEKRAAFLSEEAQVYAETYRAIEKAVQGICRERDIGIVIRVSTDSMDANDRSSVLQTVNRPVVYTATPDLTADVIAALNKISP